MENNSTIAPHYICLGGCRGVSPVPGVCTTSGCEHEGHELIECNCTDDKHNDFKKAE